MDAAIQRIVRRFVLAAVLATAVPSVVLAYRLVTQEVFNARAEQFIKAELSLPLSVVANKHIDPVKRTIDAVLVGQRVDQHRLDALSSKLPGYGLTNATLVVRQAGDERIDARALESSLKATLAQQLVEAQSVAQRDAQDKDDAIAKLQRQLDAQSAERAELERVAHELSVQYPQVRQVRYANAFEWDGAASAPGADAVPTFVVSTAKPMPRAERARLEAWLKVRLEPKPVRLVVAG